MAPLPARQLELLFRNFELARFTGVEGLAHILRLAGIGKTQLGIQLAVDVHLPLHFGGIQVASASRCFLHLLPLPDAFAREQSCRRRRTVRQAKSDTCILSCSGPGRGSLHRYGG